MSTYTVQPNQQREDFLLEVSYSVFTILKGHEKIETLDLLATAINVQLTLDEQGPIPFIVPTNFELANSQDKVFLFGPGGSGKSRLIFELVKSKLDDDIEKLYIINPRQSSPNNTHRVNLIQLASQFTCHDIVIWDNFPDGLIKKDIGTGRLALEIFSSGEARNLLIALKPKFWETYRGITQDIPDLYAYQVRYDLNQFKELLRLYGTRIPQFKEVYSNYLADCITNISKILWQKEPFPLTVYNYYRELVVELGSGKKSLDVIRMAQSMLYPTIYYQYQFEQLLYSGTRTPDVELLYTVKLCYELGLDRNVPLVELLQLRIFGSVSPKDITRNLGSWAYLSGHYISIHDVARDAIRFDDETRARIIDYLVDNLSEMVPYLGVEFDSVGVFVGRNIHLVMQHSGQDEFLSNQIYQLMKSHRRLEVAIGRGVGEVFNSLEEQLQQEILNRIEKDGEFSRGLGESVGKVFGELDLAVRNEILLKWITKSILFARGLGESLGYNFYELPQGLQNEVFEISLKEKNYNFQRGVGTGLGRKFRYLEGDIQKQLLDLTLQHIALAIGVGYGLALDYTSSSISRQFQDVIAGLLKENGEIARGLGMGLGQNFSFLNKMLQNEILGWMEENPRLEFGFAYQLSFSFLSLQTENQNFVFNRIETRSEFSYGSGWGFGVVYTYLEKDMQQRLLAIAKKNRPFATGLGAGIGNQLQYLTKKEEEDLFSIVEKDEGFAIGAGFGIGRSFTFLSKDLQDTAWRLMKTNYGFAIGFGWGLGFAFSYLRESIRIKVLEYIKKQPGFAHGLGWGLGFMFTYLSTDLQMKANDLSSQNSQFAFGLGHGLATQFNYLHQDFQQEVLAKENNPQFMLGLGSGLGYLFGYIPERLQQDILSRAGCNLSIARGLGLGFGNILPFISQDREQYLLEKAQINPELLRGLGQGLAQVFSYLSEEQRQTAVKIADTSMQFALGLGQGLGQALQYFDTQLREWIIQLSCKNEAIARGLGSGLGYVICYQKAESAHTLWRRAENDTQFAVGLGEGIGTSIDYLSKSVQDEIFSKTEHNGALSYGLGLGLANSPSIYLTPRSLYDKVSACARKNSNFSRGYGEAFGRAFGFLTESKLNSIIMSNLETNMQFAIGLGDGVGQSLTYVWPCVICNDIIKNMGIKRLLTLDGFLFGLGVGFSKVIGFSTEQIRTSILQALSKYHHFDFGLGYGLGRTFPQLQQKLQEDSLALAEKERPFASGLGLGIGLSFMYLEPVVQQGLLRFTEENYELEIGFGQGIANVFPSLNPSLQEKILELVEKREGFATGVSQGLSKSLNYLDENLQKRLTGLTKVKEQASTLGAPKSRSFAEYAYHEDDSIIILNRNSDHTLHKEWQKADSSKEKPVKAEILFSGKREKYCVCYIDMMNSTKISATLDDLQLSKYYSIFLNSMATIAKNFGATIVKNAGDCLIYYFPATADPNQQNGFRDVIECGITMISAYQTINANIFEQRLPPLNYRISSDYGKIEVARSTSSQTEDLFGSAMNVCAKINSKAPANGMVIGHNMYQMCSTFAKEYDFERIGEYSGFKEIYPIYSVKSRQKRNILNPFKPQKENISDSSFHQHTP